MDELPYPYEVKKVELPEGIKVAYVDEGKGDQTLVFIHGLGSYLPGWKKNIEGLKGQFRCIAIDLPGYGKSSKGKYEGSMRFYAKIVAELIDELNLGKVTLVGHSMGGQISIVTALAYPDKVDKLVLVAPAGFETFTKGQRQWFREVMTANGVKLTTVEQIKINLAYNFYRMPKDAEFMITDRINMRTAADFDAYCYIIPQCVQGMVDDPVYEFLPQIQQPTLVLFGENDNLIPNRFLNPGATEKVAQDGAGRIPHATLHMVPKAGHFVQFEQPDAVNGYILQFAKGSVQ
ncbi:MAG: alpha/beta hydrolase [Saprospirales bacterium]|nr:alpha/beta hydrolase [Saprospirales bacterium]